MASRAIERSKKLWSLQIEEEATTRSLGRRQWIRIVEKRAMHRRATASRARHDCGAPRDGLGLGRWEAGRQNYQC